MKTIPLIIIASLILSGSNLRAQISFTKINKLKTNAEFYAVQTADMNNDGLTDVIGATYYSWDSSPEDAKIYIYYQDDLGNLTKNTEIDYPKNYPGLYSMAIGDLNNDQFNDIVIAYSDSIGIFYQTSLNKFGKIEKYYCGGTTDRVMCQDIDNDSLIDIIAKNSDYNSMITIFKQKKTGLEKHIFPSSKHYSYEQFALGNLNQDKLTDILYYTIYDKTKEKIYVMLQNSLQGYPEDSYNLYFAENEAHKEHLSDFKIGDLNNDGAEDVLAINIFTDSLYFWKNDQFRFDKPTKIKTNEYGIKIKVEDLNCDGKNDILVMGYGAVTAHESTDDFKSFTTLYIPDQSASPTMMYNKFSTGDLDNDGKTDIAIAFLDGIVIMKNTSMPIKFNSIDTIPRYDTLSYQNDTSSYKYFQKTLIKSNENFVVYRKDSFNVVSYYKFLAYNLDTMFVRKALFCTKPYIDTVFTTKYNKYFDEYHADTTLFYTSYDTLMTALPYHAKIESNIKLFPNPTNSKIQVILPESECADNCEIEIFSPDGRNETGSDIVWTGNRLVTISLKGKNPGVYLLKVTCNGKISTKKFVKD